MRILVIGYGSIAKKHIAALRKIEPDVDILALRSSSRSSKIDGIQNIYNLDEAKNIEFIIISNPSNLHYNTLLKVLPLGLPILLEKPALTSNEQGERIFGKLENFTNLIQVGFNLRYLDSIKYINQIVNKEEIQEVNVYSGSYLPNWRPGIDYKTNYSALKKMGGGVHLDLIHELDYTTWICGQPLNYFKILRSNSHLGIDSIDFAHYTLEYENFIANVTLNYFRRDPKRILEIITKDTTYEVDLIKNKVIDLLTSEVIFSSSQTVVDTYQDQLIDFMKKIKNGVKSKNDLRESIQTLKIALDD